MRPARSTVKGDVLVPRGCAQVVSAVAAPAEVLWQPIKLHQRSWQVIVILGSIQQATSVAMVSALRTVKHAHRSHQRRQHIYILQRADGRSSGHSKMSCVEHAEGRHNITTSLHAPFANATPDIESGELVNRTADEEVRNFKRCPTQTLDQIKQAAGPAQQPKTGCMIRSPSGCNLKPML